MKKDNLKQAFFEEKEKLKKKEIKKNIKKQKEKEKFYKEVKKDVIRNIKKGKDKCFTYCYRKFFNGFCSEIEERLNKEEILSSFIIKCDVSIGIFEPDSIKTKWRLKDERFWPVAFCCNEEGYYEKKQ